MRRHIAVFVLSLAAALFFLPAAAQINETLTTQQVECNERQLFGLLGRMGLQGINDPQGARSLTLLVTFSNRFGFFQGLAVANQTPLQAETPGGSVRAENFLAFSINPSIRTTLLNPERQLLPQVSLVREESSSNVVSPGDPSALRLILNPTLASDGGESNLEINNVDPVTNAQCGLEESVDVKPGRGLILDGLTTPCHAEFASFDVFMFEILQRILRVQAPGNPSQDFKVAIYRSEEERGYRIDVYPLRAGGATDGRVALKLIATADAEGHLMGGTLSVLPDCAGGVQTGCTNADQAVDVFLFPPVFGGLQIRFRTDVAVEVSFQPGTTPQAAPVDWSQLLDATPWND